MWLARRRVRAVSLRRLRPRPTRPIFLQHAGDLPQLRRPPDAHPIARTWRDGVEWVLSLPYRLRYQLAWDHDLCRAVVGVFVRAVLGFLRARARLDGVTDGRSGAVAVIQRFGGSINLNCRERYLA